MDEWIVKYVPRSSRKNGLSVNHDVNFSSGRKVAIDASMSIYQFLIAVRQDGSVLTNEAGETTRYNFNTG